MKFLKHTIYIFTFLSTLLLSFPVSGKDVPEKTFTVVIDAGHGGKDIGATDNGAREKDINLGVALNLEKILKKKLKDIDVVMTRDNDTYLTLQQRADVANKAKGDLFISIHTNSVDKSNKNRKTVKGSSVYALGLHKDDNNMRVARRENSVIELEKDYDRKYSGFDPNKDESYIIFEMAQKKNLSKSLKFAEEVEKELVGIGRANRGVHQAGFWVLWATSMPAVLIELDFICNPTSAKYMTSEKGSKELAEAISKAVESYYSVWKKGNETMSAVKVDKSVKSVEPEAQEVATATLLARSGDSGKRKTSVAESSSRKNSSTRRRRRGDSSRESSSMRNVEVASIPLHSEKERAGKVVTLESQKEETVDVYAGLSEKERKKLEKQLKKEQKEREKKAKAEEKRKRKANAHNAKRDKFVKVYKIQILASADLLKQNNPRFCGLTPISTYKENNLYKYYYGESRDRSEMETLLKDVRKKIPDAFIVASTKSSH